MNYVYIHVRTYIGMWQAHIHWQTWINTNAYCCINTRIHVYVFIGLYACELILQLTLLGYRYVYIATVSIIASNKLKSATFFLCTYIFTHTYVWVFIERVIWLCASCAPLQHADTGALMDRLSELSHLLQWVCSQSPSTDQPGMWTHDMQTLPDHPLQSAMSLRSGEFSSYNRYIMNICVYSSHPV